MTTTTATPTATLAERQGWTCHVVPCEREGEWRVTAKRGTCVATAKRLQAHHVADFDANLTFANAITSWKLGQHR